MKGVVLTTFQSEISHLSAIPLLLNSKKRYYKVNNFYNDYLSYS